MNIHREPYLTGTDLSGWQRSIDYDALSADAVAFAWVKASQGRTRGAKRSSEHVRGLSEAGVPVGAYHFAEPSKNNPRDEVENFAAELDDLAAFDLRPVLDYEERWTRDRARNMAWVMAFVDALEDATGVTPMLYSGASLLRNRLDGHALNQRGVGLWVADYRGSAGRANAPEVRDGVEWVCWQRGSHFRPEWAGGGRVDINAAPSLEPMLWGCA